MSLQSSVLEAVRAEFDTASRPLRLKISRHEFYRDYVKVVIGDCKPLKEKHEGWTAWWPGGVAAVMTALPDEQILHLRFASGPLPANGEAIHLYPPRFLESLLRVWEDDRWATKCEKWVESLGNSSRIRPPLAIRHPPWLRVRQKEAFGLLQFRSGFMWGPPGTGKTTTLGAILANYLVQEKGRILLLSTTNSAVDQALLEVDKRLDNMGCNTNDAQSFRQWCSRIGCHFIPSKYRGHEYLLPTTDEHLVASLAALELQRPDRNNPVALVRWKVECELLRKQFSKDIGDSRLVAMTTTEAINRHEELRTAGFQIVVFDEASQIARAHAIALAPLAPQQLFAGDPKQLAPICQTEDVVVKNWMGKSVFEYLDRCESTTVQLNEQSRMAGPICDVVASLFYGGDLKVASDTVNDLSWRKEREPAHVLEFGEKHFNIKWFDQCQSAVWSKKYGDAYIRQPTAEWVANLVCNLTDCLEEEQILVVTPYHAQRALIRQKLNISRKRKVRVSTVHAAQGQEIHTVIFDPVLGAKGLLDGEDGRRLINVAISRAQAAVYIPLSPDDIQNPVFAEIYRMYFRYTPVLGGSERQPTQRQGANPILLPDFPNSAVGQKVMIPGQGRTYIGTVCEIGPGGVSFYIEFQSPKIPPKKFYTEHVVKAAMRAAGIALS